MRIDELTYFESEEFKETLARYEAALHEGRPIYMEADELTDVAEYYMTKEREEDADCCIRTALEMHPDAIDPQVFVARRELFHDNGEKARELAAAIQPQEEREVQFLWAEIRIKENRQQEASQQLMHYFRTLTEEKDYFLYDAAGVFMDYNEWDIALMWAEELKKRYPQFEKADFLLADIKVCCGKCQEAIPLLEDILSKDPFFEDAWSLLAEAHSALEHYEEALEAIEYVLALNEKSLSAMLIRANCLFHLQRMEETHAQYTAYLQECPDDASVMYFDAVTLTNMEEYEQAMRLLSTALDKVTDTMSEVRCNIYYQISYLLNKMGNAALALVLLEKSYELEEKELDSDYYLLKAQIHLENSTGEDVTELQEKALELSPDKPQTRLCIAVCYAECGMYAQSAQRLQDILSDITCIMPDKEARCLPYLAYCSHFVARDKYIAYLREAIKVNPNLTTFLFKHIYPEQTFETIRKEAGL